MAQPRCSSDNGRALAQQVRHNFSSNRTWGSTGYNGDFPVVFQGRSIHPCLRCLGFEAQVLSHHGGFFASTSNVQRLDVSVCQTHEVFTRRCPAVVELHGLVSIEARSNQTWPICAKFGRDEVYDCLVVIGFRELGDGSALSQLRKQRAGGVCQRRVHLLRVGVQGCRIHHASTGAAACRWLRDNNANLCARCVNCRIDERIELACRCRVGRRQYRQVTTA